MIRQVSDSFFRYLIDEIDWGQRMIAIRGFQGRGKTTLMLQYLKYRLSKPREEVLYLTADHYWFYTHTLVETASSFYMNGGRHLFIDEVHKCPEWSRELKNIYDGYPDMQVVFSSSSALDIYRGESDLSRRVLTYDLPGLSFREYLELSGVAKFEKYNWEDLINDGNKIAATIVNELQPLRWFKKYLQIGYLPLFTEGKDEHIPVKLNQIINTVIDTDMSYTESYHAAAALKLKNYLASLQNPHHSNPIFRQ